MEIFGHPQVLHYLTEGLKRGRLSPSLLFVGQDGVGKRGAAVELAKCFACEMPESAKDNLPRCGRCRACQQIDRNNHADLLIINRALQAALLGEKPEAQTGIKIDSVRHADKFLSLKPLEARRRTVIIEEANKLTDQAANALLKLLEEPPNNAQLVLLALNEHTLPATVLSRCAILRFRPIPSKTLADWLESAHAVGREKAIEIADRAGGSFERALELKDEDRITMELSDYTLDEFFTLLSETQWRKEGRKNAEAAVTRLIESAQKKLHAGDTDQAPRIEAMLKARRQIDRNVPPKLVLETLYVKLEGPN